MDVMDIAESNFASTHPELHYYCDFGGLTGIFTNQTIWATNYRQLNDTKEAEMLKAPLVTALTSRFRSVVEERQQASPEVRKVIEEVGGDISRVVSDLARDLVNSYYGTNADLDFYIACFCTHANNDYAREYGLLSQWRGHGGADGGYCIVFDTAAMIPMLQKEYEAHYWTLPPKLALVHYATRRFSIEEIFKPLVDASDTLLFALLSIANLPLTAMGYFLWAAPLLKHQGFSEESEARIVVIPGPKRDYDNVVAKHGNLNLPLKKICDRTDAHGFRQHVVLFEGLGLKLPIKRVLVGPSRNQDAKFANVRSLLGPDISLVRSDTPFLTPPA
jgi:hypothetical protein